MGPPLRDTLSGSFEARESRDIDVNVNLKLKLDVETGVATIREIKTDFTGRPKPEGKKRG
jgi:hypothetical protein